VAPFANEKESEFFMFLQDTALEALDLGSQLIGDFINLFVDAGAARSGADAICFTFPGGLCANGIYIFLEGFDAAAQILLSEVEFRIAWLGGFAAEIKPGFAGLIENDEHEGRTT